MNTVKPWTSMVDEHTDLTSPPVIAEARRVGAAMRFSFEELRDAGALDHAVKALLRIQSMADKTDASNTTAVQMGNIAHAALVELGLPYPPPVKS